MIATIYPFVLVGFAQAIHCDPVPCNNVLNMLFSNFHFTAALVGTLVYLYKFTE